MHGLLTESFERLEFFFKSRETHCAFAQVCFCTIALLGATPAPSGSSRSSSGTGWITIIAGKKSEGEDIVHCARSNVCMSHSGTWARWLLLR